MPNDDAAGTFHSQFTDGDARELLTILAAECSEAAVRVSKARWFGLDEIQPGQHLDNATKLGHKMGGIIEVLHRAIVAGLIPLEAIDAGRAIKQRQLATFMQVGVSEADPSMSRRRHLDADEISPKPTRLGAV